MSVATSEYDLCLTVSWIIFQVSLTLLNAKDNLNRLLRDTLQTQWM